MTTKAQLIFSSTYWKVPPALIKYLMIDSFLFKPLKISCYFNVINWVAFEISIRKLYCKSIRLYLFTKDGIRAWLVDTWDQSVGADVKAKGTVKVSWAQESWLVYHWVPSIYCLQRTQRIMMMTPMYWARFCDTCFTDSIPLLNE